MISTYSCAALATLLTSLMALPAAADDWKSAEPTRTLVQRMDDSRAEAIAVRDPDRPERFVAALRLPGQLLVVSAAHPDVDLVAGRLARGEYRDIYVDLQGTPEQDSKFFVHDLNADGLSISGRGEAYDTIYDAGQSLSCNGRWKDAKLGEDEYDDMVAAADDRYARMVTLLAAGLEPADTRR